MFNADNIIPNIDKRLIDNISDLELFKYYCSNFEEINKKFCSELRTDRNPSCYIYIKPNNKLAYKDFGSGEHYSPIEYIMKKYGLLYSECLNVIFNDFKLSNKIIPICKPENLIGYESVSDELKTPLKAKIYISSRNWRLCDNKYWGQYYITFDLLEKERLDGYITKILLVSVKAKNFRIRFRNVSSQKQATLKLFKDFSNLEDFCKLSEDVLMEYLRTINLYKTKSRNVIKMCNIIKEEYYLKYLFWFARHYMICHLIK